MTPRSFAEPLPSKLWPRVPPAPSNESSNESWSLRSSIGPVPGDELWWDGFGLPSFDDGVYCATDYNGALIAGGRFTRVGSVAAAHVARFDGTRWTPMGSGTDGDVFTMAEYRGKLVAAGSFQSAGGIASPGVAMWDGSSWSGIGSEPYPYPVSIFSLAVLQDTLVAAGWFGGSAEDPVGPVARWDGTTWISMGHEIQGAVRALVIYQGELYAAGQFTLVGVPGVPNVARWNGSAWVDVGGGARNTVQTDWAGSVECLEVYQGQLVAGGEFDTAGELLVSNVAAWNGTSWGAFGPDDLPGVHALANVHGMLYLATWTGGLYSWDGTNVSQFSPPLLGTVRDFHEFGTAMVVVGFLELRGTDGVTPLAFNLAVQGEGGWHGLESWGPGMRGLRRHGGGNGGVSHLAYYRGAILATGEFEYTGDPSGWKTVPYFGEWDGLQWRTFDPAPPGPPNTILVHQGSLYAGGLFPGSTTGTRSPVCQFDGSQWTTLGDSEFRAGSLAFYKGDLWTSGQDLSFVLGSRGIHRWDGSRWQTMGTARNTSWLFTTVANMVEYDGQFIVAGIFNEVDGIPISNIASWDGRSWRQFGSGLDGEVYSLAIHQGDLIATGSFQLPDGTAHVIRWAGEVWERLGSVTVQGGPPVVANAEGHLFLGGRLHLPDMPDVSHGVLRWTGDAWEPLGSGTNGPVHAIQGHGPFLYVGGRFSSAGGRGSFSIARWDGFAGASPAPSFLPPAPNPFRTSTLFRYDLPSSGNVRVVVYDLMGRKLKVLQDGPMPSGSGVASWDGTDTSGRRVSAGVYFVRADLPGNRHVSRKSILLR